MDREVENGESPLESWQSQGRPSLPYSRQRIYDDDVAKVVEVLRRDLITQGPEVEAFEEDLARRVGARYAVAFNSGTSALIAAVRSLELDQGVKGVVPAITFAASATALVHAGVTPVIADVDPATGLLSPDTLEAAIDPSVVVVVAVHYAGFPLDMDEVGRVARRHGLAVIEDAAHALGASRAGDPVGSCRNSDATIFSFHPVKAITTGEGGALVTNDATIAERARRFRHHGIVPTPDVAPWVYDVRSLGINGRITDFQCALGRSQLAKLDRHVEARNRLARRYDDAFGEGTPVRPAPRPSGEAVHAYHIYPALLPSETSRLNAFEALRARGVGVQVHYVPLHHHTFFKSLGAPPPEALPGAESFYRRELSLPIYPGLSDAEQDRVVELLLDSLR